jgi:PAS domain S-box-containing protein
LETNKNKSKLISEIEDLKNQLFEANGIIEAIREGEVDALVLSKNGEPYIYTLESADYTYRILIENFGEGALSLSAEGLILYCNEYFSKLVGIRPDKIIGTYFSSYVESPAAFEELKSNLLNTGSGRGEILLRINDKRLHVSLSLTDLRPNVEALGVVVTDLTEKRKNDEALVKYQQKLEHKVEELNHANASLEQFIHVISHDIKEPLRKILMYTSHLSTSNPGIFSEKEQRNLSVINSSALRLNSLVDDLVTYAFSANKSENNTVNLNKMLREVLDDLELVINENRAEITFLSLPEIVGSKVQMRQLLSNLISNAIKYSRKDVAPKITISAAMVSDADVLLPEGNFYVISIEDNGIGMEEAHLNKIFTIFQRLHMRNEYSGNGIGLAICKKIMENHHGKIDVQSVVGKGSTFRLFFPIK